MVHFKLNKDIVTLGIGNIIRFFLLILYSRLQTYFLSYEELSKFYLIFSVYTFFSFTIIGPIGVYVTRNIIEWYNSNQLIDALKKVYFKIIIPISLIALILISSSSLFVDFDANFIILGCLISLIIIAKTGNELIYPFFNLIDKNTIYLILIILFHFLNPLFSYIAIELFSPTYDFWLLGLILSNLIVGLIGLKLLFRVNKNQKKINLNFETIKSFSLYIMIGNLLGWILTDGFRFIAENEIGLTSVGILILGLMGASQIFANVENFLNQLLTPKYIQSISNSNYDKRSKAFNMMFNVAIPVYLILAIMTSLIAKYIIAVIIDSSKINDLLITAFIIGIWIEFLKSLINILKNISTSEYKTKSIVWPYFVGVIILILGFLFIKNLDIISISLLILTSYVFTFIFCILIFNHIIKIRLKILFMLKYIVPSIIIGYFFYNLENSLYSFISIPVYLLLIYSLINQYLNKKELS